MVLRRNKIGGVSPNQVTVPLDVTVYGRTKNFTANELGNGLIQGDTEITITNTEIAAAQWPGPPMTNDKFIVDGRERTVKSVEPKYLGPDVLVYVCQVTGG